MGREISEEVLFNRQVNYILIEKLWEYHNKNIDKQKLYEMLDINKNAYSRIRIADDYNLVDLEKQWEKKNSVIRKIGLSKEIMIGLERIETDKVSADDWRTYIDYRYINKDPSPLRTKEMQKFNRKLKTLFDGLVINKRTESDIGKLYYFIVYGRAITLEMPDAEMVDLKDSLKNVTVEKMKMCDKELRKEVFEILKNKYKQMNTIINYENLKD